MLESLLKRAKLLAGGLGLALAVRTGGRTRHHTVHSGFLGACTGIDHAESDGRAITKRARVSTKASPGREHSAPKR